MKSKQGEKELIESMAKHIKINVMGTKNVGKSTFISMLINNGVFIDFKDNPEVIINSEITTVSRVEKKEITLPNLNSKYEVSFVESNLDDEVTAMAYKEAILYNTTIIVFVVDLSDKTSVTKLQKFLKALDTTRYISEDKILLLCNKSDIQGDKKEKASAIKHLKEIKSTYPSIVQLECSLTKCTNFEFIKQYISKFINDKEGSEPNMIKFSKQRPSPKDKTNILAIKLFLLGDSSVGKTAFIRRYFLDDFKINWMTTIGVDVEKKIICIKDKIYQLNVWDTAGQEKLRAIPRQYYTKSDGFFLMFDVTKIQTFKALQGWIADIQENADVNKTIVIIIIGNKIDSNEPREVSYEEALRFANDNKFKYIEVSCKLGLNISEALSQLIIESYRNLVGDRQSVIDLTGGLENSSRGCCGGKK